jgi:4-hydroxybenzoate polyprenyltransferase
MKLNEKPINLLALFRALRPSQWLKNLSLFAAPLLNGQLTNPILFTKSFIGFIIFCLLSSSAYLINDIADAPRDRLHPVKNKRPIASRAVSESLAVTVSVFLLFGALSLTTLINFYFFLISLVFIILQYSYSFFLKKQALIDIIGISSFFIIRAFAGELATGYHLPVWIMMAVIFLSLFIASGKRRSELVTVGRASRRALIGYGKGLLNFYTTMFAVCTLISYSMFTFFAEPIGFQGIVHHFLLENFPNAIYRKWYMVTILPVIIGLMRYGQLIFEMQEGERPEDLITTDLPLLFSVLLWGLLMITIIYVL